MTTKETLLNELNREKKVIAEYMAIRKVLNAEILRLQHLIRDVKLKCERFKMHHNILRYDDFKSKLHDLEWQLKTAQNKKEELKVSYTTARQKHDAILSQLEVSEILESQFTSVIY